MLLMSEHSKSTMIALNLELLRVEINNKYMEQVIGQLGRAVSYFIFLDWDLLVFEESAVWFEE